MKKLQVLGTGCPRCRKLAEAVENAAEAMGIDYRMEKVTDIADIVRMGVMMTPALAVDGVVRASGRIPSAEELKAMIAG
jgi:small redox-active disulfide protein 2